MAPADVLILSNGPGEITTWVKPVVAALRQQHPHPEELRISVVLSPCPNATGQEGAIARRYPEVDRVQEARHFWPFLLWGNTHEGWDWRDRGIVLFLGGDQIYPVVIGRRLGYKTVVYAEWFANWRRWVDAFAAMNADLVQRTPERWRAKFTVIGDLMGDAQSTPEAQATVAQRLGIDPARPLIGLLPGSKPAKLTQGVPLLLATADAIRDRCPTAQFVIPVAPTLDPATLLAYADRDRNAMVSIFHSPGVTLIPNPAEGALPYLKTDSGTVLHLWTDFPAYDLTTQCALCLTSVGANTAELGALGVPMIVLLPTQQLEAMNAWDGLLGLLVNVPGVGRLLNLAVNRIFLAYIQRRGKRFAWPNLWAKREIVPELLGPLTAAEVSDRVLDYLHHPEKLDTMRQDLRAVRGETGAAQKLVDLIDHVLAEGG